LNEFSKTLCKQIHVFIDKNKKLRKFGTNSLFDDRTFMERFKDNALDFLSEITPKPWIRKEQGFRMNFISFFDLATGERVSSMEDIKRREKEGKILTTPKEIHENAQRIKAHKKKVYKERLRRELGEAMHQINQGRKFSQEILSQKENVEMRGKGLGQRIEKR